MGTVNCPFTTPDVTEQLDPVILSWGGTSSAQKISQIVSIKLKLVPVTVTAEPVPPLSGESTIEGITIVNVTDAEPGTTCSQGGAPSVSVIVIV